MAIRSPLCVVLAHVDHGKTSILDRIRGSAIARGEAGGITQAIGASIIPLEIIKRICGKLLETLKMNFTIPGLLFIDTPGHAGFTSLRKRGGNLADIAILVIDINEGLKPQTVESIEILKQYKTPFVIAANKIDLVPGWQSSEKPLLQSIAGQSQNLQHVLDTKLYEIVGKLAEMGFDSERFDRVDDFTKRIAIIPTSAKTGEGIPELLMILSGLAQKFLEKTLKLDTSANAKGTILEVKEEKGLGKSMDVILYDGSLKKGDTIIIGTLTEPIVTKVKGLFEPLPLKEMRDKKSKFSPMQEVYAATGVKISATGIDEVLAGMPLRSAKDQEIEKVKQEIKEEIEEVLIHTDKEGIIIKADTLGSLEALDKLLKEKQVPIQKASLGNITKKDISDAEANYEKDPLKSVILAFSIAQEQSTDKVKIIQNNVIYKLLEDFDRWQQDEKARQEQGDLHKLIMPSKFQIMRGYVFRQNNPAVVGVDVLAGTLKVGTPLMKEDGKEITEVKSIQQEQESISKAEKGKQVAVSMEGVTVGRQINEGETLYSSIPEDQFRKLKELKKHLSDEDKEILKEIAAIKRKENPVWGV
ncbi:MAG TPA: translation initiation factor IF-2 [Candidatus Nanoarchaeia archaeon]|nr:translation initiation factor IF-2 [Candidatus Nanoarchaeia archaeon]